MFGQCVWGGGRPPLAKWQLETGCRPLATGWRILDTLGTLDTEYWARQPSVATLAGHHQDTRPDSRPHTGIRAPPHFTAQVSCRLVLLGAFSRRLAPPITQLIKSRAGATIERNGNIKLFILGAPTALGSARHARQKQRARSFIKPKWGPEHWVASDRARKLSIWRIRCARSCNNIHLCIRGPHSWAPHFALH